jgi:hypothetical protein
MIDLTPEQAAPHIASLLAAHESRTLEFKRMGDNKVVRKLLEAICALSDLQINGKAILLSCLASKSWKQNNLFIRKGVAKALFGT